MSFSVRGNGETIILITLIFGSVIIGVGSFVGNSIEKKKNEEQLRQLQDTLEQRNKELVTKQIIIEDLTREVLSFSETIDSNTRTIDSNTRSLKSVTKKISDLAENVNDNITGKNSYIAAHATPTEPYHDLGSIVSVGFELKGEFPIRNVTVGLVLLINDQIDFKINSAANSYFLRRVNNEGFYEFNFPEISPGQVMPLGIFRDENQLMNEFAIEIRVRGSNGYSFQIIAYRDAFDERKQRSFNQLGIRYNNDKEFKILIDDIHPDFPVLPREGWLFHPSMEARKIRGAKERQTFN